LLPSILADSLGEKSHLVAGGIVAAMFAISTATVIVGRRLSSRSAMLAGVSLLLPSLALLVLAQLFASMPLLLIGTAVGGVAAAFGYRGGLEVVNQIAPQDRRAELVSSYFLACFTGNSLPVIGVGALTMVASSLIADTVFALVTALVALTALLVGRRYLPKS
jgi:MFS family permease